MSTYSIKEIAKSQNISEVKQLKAEDFKISEISLVEILKEIYDNEDDVNIDFIVFLIENGIDIKKSINIKEEDTFEEKANLLLDNIDFDAFLIENGIDIKEEETFDENMNVDINPLTIAFSMYNKELIHLLLDNGLVIKDRLHNRNPFSKHSLGYVNYLDKALSHGDIEMSRYLLKENICDIEDSGVHIEFSCHNGDFEMVQLLVESGIDTDFCFTESPMYSTVIGLLDSIAKNNGKSYDTYINIIEYLIKKGANLNIGTLDEISPFACLFKVGERLDMQLIQLFIDNGADVNGRDEEGNTPLMLLNCASIRERHALSTEDDPDGVIALRAKYKKLISIIKLLINSGADINARNNMGMTALMIYAMKNCSLNTLQLIIAGADISITSNMTAFDLTSDNEIKGFISEVQNHTPQKLVKILTNFTLDKPIKFTTHTWDFGDLKKEYKDFNGYMTEVQKQFKSFGIELKDLSPNLHKKIETFLLETNPEPEYSWCSKATINIGWSSLDGLREWCNDGKNPFDFELSKPIVLDRRTKLTKFGEVIELFKQEIEIRRDFDNLATVFDGIKSNLGNDYSLTTQKIGRQFYTDVEKFTITLDKIFDGIKKHSEHKDIEVIANEFEDGTIELRIIQVDSPSTLDADNMFAEVEDGDFADIKANLTNLCDWSVEGSFEESNFRINYLKSNNVKDIVELNAKPAGFTHVLKFYKR